MCVAQDTYHQLVILGNGFDLSCGLHSGFSSFFERRTALIEECAPLEGADWVNALRAAGLTAWDLILYTRKLITTGEQNANWCDVEKAVTRVIGMKGTPDNEQDEDDEIFESLEDELTVSSICDYFYYLQKHPGIVRPIAYAEEREDEFVESDDYGYADFYHDVVLSLPNSSSEYVGLFLKDAYPERVRWDEGDVYDVLFQELGMLEAEFARHLRTEVNNSPRYGIKSEQLLGAIVAEGMDELEVPTGLDILSFNYTSPAVPARFGGQKCIVNVHGRLDEEIIIGADGTGSMGDRSIVRFSKTYRTARLNHGGMGRRLAYRHQSRLPGESETIAIKFFGHSLSAADYSYFQTIFDIVDLYSGTACLYFFFTNYRPDAEEELLTRVSKLLDSYGSTLDNKDHGRNLMHRLLLENRLVFKEIPISPSNA